MSTKVSRDNDIIVSAVADIDNYDTAKELEAKVAEKILENGQAQYDGFSSSVELKEVDPENGTAEYTVEIRFTDYGEFYEGSPSNDYYDPSDPGELVMDDVRDVLSDVNDFVEKAFDDLGVSADAEEVDYDIEDTDSIFEKMCEEQGMDAYEYYE